MCRPLASARPALSPMHSCLHDSSRLEACCVPQIAETAAAACSISTSRHRQTRPVRCRALLASMLTVNAAKRITVEALHEHPWFTENAPDVSVQAVAAAIDAANGVAHAEPAPEPAGRAGRVSPAPGAGIHHNPSDVGWSGRQDHSAVHQCPCLQDIHACRAARADRSPAHTQVAIMDPRASMMTSAAGKSAGSDHGTSAGEHA